MAMEWPSHQPRSCSNGAKLVIMEHQFLPPSSSSSSSPPSPPSTSPMKSSWSEDPSRVQQLMMGSIATGSKSKLHTTTTPVADLDNNHNNKPLPLGWERCLDLKSGEVFIKKKPEFNVDSNTASMSTSRRSVEVLRMQNEAINNRRKSHTDAATAELIGVEEGKTTSPLLCLDLDLKLTNGQIHPANKSSTKSSKLSKLCKLSKQSTLQNWKWQPRLPTTVPGGDENYHSNIYEEAPGLLSRESTMATAVCPKCLMYVLLRKSSPTCPKCCTPVLLHHQPHSSKRSRVEIAPADGLSLSTR